jgi:hypothetical protein
LEPSPGPTPPAHEVIEGLPEEAGWGGLFDIPGMVADAITGVLGELIELALEPFLGLLGATLLATPQVTGNGTLAGMWGGSLGVASGAYVLLVVAGGVTLMGHETVQTRYTVKQVAPRLVVGLVAAAGSLLVVEHAITVSNALSGAVLDTGDLDTTGQGMASLLLGSVLGRSSPLHLLVLALVLLVLVAAVLVGYLTRVAMVALLAVSGPLALACHALPQTEGVAKLWWRALGGCLAIQVAQATALAVGLRLLFAPGGWVLGLPNPGQLETLLSGLCLFWVLWKIPAWTVQVVLRGTPASMPHTPAPVRALRGVAVGILLHRYLPAGHGAAARSGTKAAAVALPSSRPAEPERLAGPPGAGPDVPGASEGEPRPGGVAAAVRRPPGPPAFREPVAVDPVPAVVKAAGPPPAPVFQPADGKGEDAARRPRRARGAPGLPQFRPPEPTLPAAPGGALGPVPGRPRFAPAEPRLPGPPPRRREDAPPPAVFRPPTAPTPPVAPPSPSVPPALPVFRPPARPPAPPDAARRRTGDDQ